MREVVSPFSCSQYRSKQFLTCKDAGWRPFSCETCGKSFGRQDSLARHKKLHIRDGADHADGITASTSNPQSVNISTTPNPSLTPEYNVAGMNDLAELTPVSQLHQQPGVDSGEFALSPPQSSASHFLAPELSQWPDSEGILQFLMSDSATWPLTLPITQFSPQDPVVPGQDGSIPGIPLPDGGTGAIGRGYQAVQQVTMLITDLVRTDFLLLRVLI